MARQIKLENLSIKQNDKVLYDNVGLDINEGDRYIYIGPNGIGKSLLLELICLGNSRELASRYKGVSITGKILYKGDHDLLDPATPRKIAYVSQSEDFYRGMTVKEICMTSCNGIGVDFDEERFDYLLKAFGIYEKKNQKVKNNVSFGEGKIVHIISRLLKLGATDLFILDEPLNHLSFKNSKVFNDLIVDEIRKNPRLSVIMVSHCRAMSFTDKAMVYLPDKRSIEIQPYHSYDCFTNDYAECP